MLLLLSKKIDILLSELSKEKNIIQYEKDVYASIVFPYRPNHGGRKAIKKRDNEKSITMLRLRCTLLNSVQWLCYPFRQTDA